MNQTFEKLLHILYYSPNVGATSIKKLYEKVKNRGITQKQVREFIEKQESHQMFKKKYFPIYAQFKNQIYQMDLIDMSDLSSSNKNFKYLLTCIDVYSRFVYMVPIKNKMTSTIIEALEEIFKVAKPETITVDQGSEFTNL